MKGNIKTLSVLVGVLGIALFVMVGMASAGSAIPNGIHGLYAVTGFSACNPAGPGILEGDYTFSNDGTGSAQGVLRSLSASGGGFATYTVNFMYEVTQEGRITFLYPWYGNTVKRPDNPDWFVTWNVGPSHGVISPDGKTITISCGPPVQLEVVDSSPGAPPVGTNAYCVTTAVGVRLQ